MKAHDLGVVMSSARTQTGRDDWGTPLNVFLPLYDEFRFLVDAAANAENTLCQVWFGPGSKTAEDALTASWITSVWVNPPYSRTAAFLGRAARSYNLNRATVVALVAARTDTRWWVEAEQTATEIRLITGRITFVGAPHPAPFPSAVIIWRAGERSSGMPRYRRWDYKRGTLR